MDWLVILQEIFEVCIVPLLGILTTYFVKWVKIKTEEIQSKEDNELYTKYIDMLSNTITSCVIATNQTYVNALKEKNAFTIEAQEEAFKRTKDAVLSILSQEAMDYLNSAVGDLNAYIEKKIEEEVLTAKAWN